MKKKIVKTVDWTDCQASLESLAYLETGAKPKNFAEFLLAYGCLPYSHLSQACGFIEDFLMNKNDHTHSVVLAEDKCLFAKDANGATVVSVVLDVLHSLDLGGELPSLWCYLDDEKKAIVHFVEHHGYYAEIYCEAKQNSSAVHLIETDQKKEFIPVIFTDDLTSYAKQADLRGSVCLRGYSPRETLDLLSNKSGGRRRTQEKTEKQVCNSRRDKGDCL